MGDNRFDPVMASRASLITQPDLAKGGIHIIIEQDHIRKAGLIKIHKPAHGFPGQVHVGLRLEQRHFFTLHHPFRHQSLALGDGFPG
ncbi:hypothetical protein D3C76_1688470 [compost metagenome]